MRIMIVGAAGTAGRAIHRLMDQRGHDIVTVGRTTGDVRCDISEEEQVTQMWQQVGNVDAVVSAAGEVPYAPLAELGSQAFHAAWTQKGLAQINWCASGWITWRSGGRSR